MKRSLLVIGAATLVILALQPRVQARGFGAVRGGAVAGPRGVAAGGARAHAVSGPFGGAHAGAARSGTYVGPRGTTIQHAEAGRVSRGPLGGVHAHGAEATRITGPGGRTYTTGGRAGATVGPAGGVRAHAARGTAVSGPHGAAAVGHRGGVAAGPFGGVAAGATRGGVAVGRYGGVAAGRVGGVAVGRYGGVAAGRVGGVAVGHATRYVSPVALRTNAAYVRTGFGYSCFTPNWYRAHPVAWVAPRWTVASFWVPPVWPSVSVYCGVTAPPISYDYGSTVVIQNENVYVNGEQVATTEQYASQAAEFADRGRAAKPAESEAWQPLGAFGLIQGEEKVAQRIFQLAVDKTGIVRGNYYDAVADSTLPVYGSVDAKSQRVGWSIGEKKDIVFEAGLTNLTQDQSTVMVHYGKDRSDQMVLVRLEEPKEEKK
jgi:hypothetical protein